MGSYQKSKIYSNSDVLKIIPKYLYDLDRLQPVIKDPSTLVNNEGEVQCKYIYPWMTVPVPIIDPNDKKKKNVISKVLSTVDGRITIDASLPYYGNIREFTYESFADIITDFTGGVDVSVSKESFAIYENEVFRKGDIIDLVPYNESNSPSYTGRILDFDENKIGDTCVMSPTTMRLDCSTYGQVDIQTFSNFDISSLYKIRLHSN